MWWRRRNIAIVSRCAEATFSLTGEDKADCIEGMGMFKYFWSLLDQLEDDWLEVLRNIRKSRQVWGRLRKILRREGEETFIS